MTNTKLGRPSKESLQTEELEDQCRIATDTEIENLYNKEYNLGRERGFRARIISRVAAERGIRLGDLV